MSAPSALTVIYPPSFQNSFWSHPSYRKGAQSLYAKLQAGLDENDTILAFVAHRAELEYNHAEALATPPPQPSLPAPLFRQAGGIIQEVLASPVSPLDGPIGSAPATRGFPTNTSATSHAFRLIQAETTSAHANAHGKVARNLEKTILDPFGKWALEHRERVTASWEHVDASLTRFERQKTEVDKLKNNYESKCRAADEAEDDARFAPVEEAVTASPPTSKSNNLRLPQGHPQQNQQRSVSSDSTPSVEGQSHVSDPERLKRRETLRKQFGFSHRAASATHAPTPSKEFAGVKLPPLPTETEGESLDGGSSDSGRHGASSSPLLGGGGLKRAGTISAFVNSAVDKMPAPIKAAVGGVVSGEPRHVRLRRDADNAEKVYEEAVRNLDRTRCHVEETLFEHYGLTQRWESDRIRAVQAVLASYNQALSSQLPILSQSVGRGFHIHEGLNPSLELRAMIREARTGPFVPAIERFQPYYHDEISLGRKTGSQSIAYGWLTKNGGFGLDLALVERIEYLERLEQQQNGTAASSESTDDASRLALLPPVLEALLAALQRAYEADERWPSSKAAAHVESDPEKTPKDATDHDTETEEEALVTRGQEKRKTWVLEVPLPVTHRLRDGLIAQLNPSHADMIYGDSISADGNPRSIPDRMLDAYDPPVLAACIKLWLLELEHSLIMGDLWDQIDSIYRAAAGQEREALAALQQQANNEETKKTEAEQTEEEEQTNGAADATKRKTASVLRVDKTTEEKIRAGVLDDLRVVLGKLPRIHLACLDALASHLYRLVTSTKSPEADAIYLNKLGLALGRAVLRPRHETPYSITVPNATLVVMDLIQYYPDIFPALVEKKLKEKNTPAAAASNGNGVSSSIVDGQRRAPIRKRTKPVDQRIKRSSIGTDLQQGAKILMEQMDERERGPRPPGKDAKDVPPVPSLPMSSMVAAATEGKTESGPDPLSEETTVAAAPPAIVTSDLASATKDFKTADDAAAPTPLTERVLSSSASDKKPVEPVKEAETMPIEDEDKPLSNVARLSRQFNSGNLGGSGSRVSSGSSTTGGPRGPRPAGARSARMSGQFSSSSTASDSSSKTNKRESRDLAPTTTDLK
ncbi:hypothetical protein BCV70DRAFT_198230 [Testicularia cyperi]|uniref:Rho-GAP domain-containing protein n=1 Tax=Testicularia cyperi TaxID=1882483 RepID=A0A317XV56_9BASI|nr:hypothetical protein BCV70DRAFT_198230 [Testicularia cyperi]